MANPDAEVPHCQDCQHGQGPFLVVFVGSPGNAQKEPRMVCVECFTELPKYTELREEMNNAPPPY